MKTDSTTKSGNIDGLRLRILTHIGLYRITTRQTLQRIFPKTSAHTIGNELRHLISNGLLKIAHKGANNESCYQLTRQGAAQLGLPTTRALSLGADSLYQNLMVLHFCCLGIRRRHRLEKEEVEKIFSQFGADAPKVSAQSTYCLEAPPNPSIPACLCEIYVPRPNTELEHFDRHILRRARACIDSPLRRASESSEYALAILVDNPHRKVEMNQRCGPLLHSALGEQAKSLLIFIEDVSQEKTRVRA